MKRERKRKRRRLDCCYVQCLCCRDLGRREGYGTIFRGEGEAREGRKGEM